MTLEQLMYELRVAVMGEVTAPVDEEKIQHIFNEYENIIRDNIRELALQQIKSEQESKKEVVTCEDRSNELAFEQGRDFGGYTREDVERYSD